MEAFGFGTPTVRTPSGVPPSVSWHVPVASAPTAGRNQRSVVPVTCPSPTMPVTWVGPPLHDDEVPSGLENAVDMVPVTAVDSVLLTSPCRTRSSKRASGSWPLTV